MTACESDDAGSSPVRHMASMPVGPWSVTEPARDFPKVADQVRLLAGALSRKEDFPAGVADARRCSTPMGRVRLPVRRLLSSECDGITHATLRRS